MGNPYILLSILRLTLSMFSANWCYVWHPKTLESHYFIMEIHTFCSPYWGLLWVCFLRIRAVRDNQRHLNPIIFPKKSIHFAFHTGAYVKFVFCEFVLCVTPKDTWILSFSHGNPYILLSILRLTLSLFSANPCCAWPPKTFESYHFPKEIHTLSFPYWGLL